MSLQRHLVVMARAPQLGRGKRRLATDIGALGAHRFYRFTSAALIRRLARDRRWKTWLALTPDAALRDPASLAGLVGKLIGPDQIIPQGSGDLGARMGALFEDLPPGPVVIVGSDIPGIEPRHIAQAFDALGGHDAVLGPAHDGGYWLIGARRRPSVIAPFKGVRWSTADTLSDTLANLRGRRIKLLETLTDVDRGADLNLLRQG